MGCVSTVSHWSVGSARNGSGLKNADDESSTGAASTSEVLCSLTGQSMAGATGRVVGGRGNCKVSSVLSRSRSESQDDLECIVLDLNEPARELRGKFLMWEKAERVGDEGGEGE